MVLAGWAYTAPDHYGFARLVASGAVLPNRPVPDFGDDPSDAELLAVCLIRERLGVRTVTELPFQLDLIVPVVQIAEIPGGAQRVPGIDTAVVEYDAYDTDRSRAKSLAAAVRECLLAGSGYRCQPSGTPWASWVTEQRRPTLLAYDDASDIRRFGGAVTLRLHCL